MVCSPCVFGVVLVLETLVLSLPSRAPTMNATFRLAWPPVVADERTQSEPSGEHRPWAFGGQRAVGEANLQTRLQRRLRRPIVSATVQIRKLGGVVRGT